MMRLLWSSRSPFVRKVMVVAHELGLADRIERVPAVVAPSLRPGAELLARNPLGRIPVLLPEAGPPLFESAVICEYLDGLGRAPVLFPAAGEARLAALRWQALGTGHCEMLVNWRAEQAREAPAAAVLEGYTLKQAAILPALEAAAPALAAAPFGIGHIAIGCALSYLDFRFAGQRWREARPALTAWHDGFRTRASVRATEHVDA